MSKTHFVFLTEDQENRTPPFDICNLPSELRWMWKKWLIDENELYRLSEKHYFDYRDSGIPLRLCPLKK